MTPIYIYIYVSFNNTKHRKVICIDNDSLYSFSYEASHDDLISHLVTWNTKLGRIR